MHSPKLLAGPKVSIDQIRWPKLSDIKFKPARHIVFDMEVMKHRFYRDIHINAIGNIDPIFHDFGPRGVGNADVMKSMFDKLKAMHMRHVDNAVGIARAFDPAMREGVVMRPDWFVPAGVQRGQEIKVIKAREGVGIANHFDFIKRDNMCANIIKFKEPDHIPRVNLVPDVVIDPREALKGFWEDAKAPKVAMPHNHPAFKGVFRGRDHGPLPSHKLELNRQFGRFGVDRLGGLEQHRGGIGIGAGAFGDVWRAWAGIDVDFGGIHVGDFFDHHALINKPLPDSTYILEKRAKRKAKEQEKTKDRNRLRKQQKDEGSSYIRIMAKQLDTPGVDVCQVIANMYAYIKSTGISSLSSLVYDALGTRGYNILGNGHFSSAFKGPDGLVYKVNSNNSNIDGWYAYAVNSMYFGKELACVPKIESIAYKDKTYCVKMELLVPMNYIDFEKCGSLGMSFTNKNVAAIMKKLELSQDHAEQMIELITRTKLESNGARFDIHSDNVMFRVDAEGNKTVVLTDPFAYGAFEMSFFDERVNACKFVDDVGQLLAA